MCNCVSCDVQWLIQSLQVLRTLLKLQVLKSSCKCIFLRNRKFYGFLSSPTTNFELKYVNWRKELWVLTWNYVYAVWTIYVYPESLLICFSVRSVSVSVTLMLGLYGSSTLSLGPNCSLQIRGNPLFVEYVKVIFWVSWSSCSEIFYQV